MFGHLFKRSSPILQHIEHPTLGELQFDPATSEWESVQGSEIYLGGIQGDSSGPYPKNTAEVSERLAIVDKYWAACSKDLLYISSRYESLPKVNDPRELFKVSALSLYSSYWEICFETKPEYKWLYVGMQFEGEDLVSNTIDT